MENTFSKGHVIKAAYDLADNWQTSVVRVSQDFFVLQVGNLYIEPLVWCYNSGQWKENRTHKFNALDFITRHSMAYPQMSGEYMIMEYGLSGERKLDDYTPLWELQNGNIALRFAKFFGKIASPNTANEVLKPVWLNKCGPLVPRQSLLYANVWNLANQCGGVLKDRFDSVDLKNISDCERQLAIFNEGANVPEGAVPFARAIGDILSGKTMGA